MPTITILIILFFLLLPFLACEFSWAETLYDGIAKAIFAGIIIVPLVMLIGLFFGALLGES